MPRASFSRIREVSSEDEQHSAQNLIQPQHGKKWKTRNVGEKSAYVVFEMGQAQKITGIDIGNEHSAFVEVLVGNSTCMPSDFKEILITCSFMTPIESRSSNNANRVRCFNADALVPTVAEEKWSLIKVICTQPFNKHVHYGLSFIKVHVAQNTKAMIKPDMAIRCSENETASPLHVGKFKLREDSPDSESEAVSKLFNRWKKSKNKIGKTEQTAAASIRLASNATFTKAKSPDTNVRKTQHDRMSKDFDVLDRNREDPLFGDSNEGIVAEKKLQMSKKIEVDKQRRLSDLQNRSEHNRSSIAEKRVDKSVENVIAKVSLTQLSEVNTSPKVSALKNVNKRHSSPPAETQPQKRERKSKIPYKPFNKLLEGVILVISGIQNPDRSDLRNKALALGAKYKSDWDHSCTHLICAFKNTPKYNQVRGKGKIITRTWIEKCYSSKKYLPWRRYALDSQEVGKPESDEEIHDESLKQEDYFGG